MLRSWRHDSYTSVILFSRRSVLCKCSSRTKVKRGHLHFHQKKDFQNLKARFNIFKIVFRNSEARLKPAKSQKRKRSLFIAEYNRELQKKQLYPGLEQHWQLVAIRGDRLVQH